MITSTFFTFDSEVYTNVNELYGLQVFCFSFKICFVQSYILKQAHIEVFPFLVTDNWERNFSEISIESCINALIMPRAHSAKDASKKNHRWCKIYLQWGKMHKRRRRSVVMIRHWFLNDSSFLHIFYNLENAETQLDFCSVWRLSSFNEISY